MYSLGVSEALTLVRKNFDEVMFNESDMIGDDMDMENFEDVLKKTLPEAINEVHAKAPASILDGETLSASELQNVSVLQDCPDVLTFRIGKEFLRLVAFRVADSPYVVTDTYGEATNEGRMQLNPYTRGTYDRPRMIISQGKALVPGMILGRGVPSFEPDILEEEQVPVQDTYFTDFRYYSLREPSTPAAAASKIEKFQYLPMHRYSATTTSYKVAENVVEAVIDCLTARMLAIYGNNDKANYFLMKAGLVQPPAQA